MEGLTELIPSLLKEGDAHMWDEFCGSCKELRVFVKKPSESVSLINSLLNEPSSRYYGLKLLDIFLSQCFQSIVNEHLIQWFRLCVVGMAQPVSKSQYPLSCQVTSRLIEMSIEFPDVRKQVSLVSIPEILHCILDKLKDFSHNHIPVLNCLFNCLLFYGKSCGKHRESLEQLLINLTLSDRLAVPQIAKCFHILAQTGAPGFESANYKQNWYSQQLIIVNSLHAVLDQLFFGVHEVLGNFNLSLPEKRKLFLPSVNDKNPLVKAHKLSLLFKSLCQFLECMLLNFFPVSKKVHPEAIFSVICRALAVSYKSLEAKISNSAYSIMSIISEVHIITIKLLNSLIVSSRSNLLPFSSLVCKLFVQMFKGSDVDNWLEGREKPFNRVRQASYKCLLAWLSVAKSCSLNDTQINIIVDAIIKDIKCHKKIVCLKLESKTKNKVSKKTTPVECFNKVEINTDTCHSALACIPQFVRNPLTLVVVKNLQEVVVKLLFEIQRMLKYENGFPKPYSDPNCRALLYSALLSLCVSPHPNFPPPLHYANILFNAASLDCDVGVQRVCSNAICSIAHLLRPCAPSFDFHFELDSEIIPIDPYPELSEKESKSISDCSNQEVVSLKNNGTETLRVGNGAKKNVDTSNEIKNNETSTSKRRSKADFMETQDKNSFIDLNDSSDESLILVDSDRKTDLCNGEGNKKSNKSLKSRIMKETSKDVKILNNKDTSVDEVTIIEMTENETLKKRANISCSSDLSESPRSINDSNSKSDISIIDRLDCETSNCFDSSIDIGCTDEIIEVDGHSDINEIADNSRTINNVFHSKARLDQSKIRRSLRCSTNKFIEEELDLMNVPEPEEIEFVEIPPRGKRKKCTSSKSSRNSESKIVTHQPETENLENETLLSEDLSIIEPTPKSPLTRSRRNYKASALPDTSYNDCINIGNVTTITDEDEPSNKKSKANKHSSGRAFGNITADFDGDKENDSGSVCEIDDEDEMLSSFVDSVPF